LHVTDISVADQEASTERRCAQRRRALLGAEIIHRNGSIRGQILNVSDTGAMLRPVDHIACPNKFSLQPRLASPRSCEVVWRRGDVVGIKYLD
jgi:hypothetical protein